jgi:hypothetical protein
MPLREATTFASQFDASLIVYNLEACKCRDRFEITVPDRLVASVAAGIPVAMPKHGYGACKEYLAGYRALIEFESPSELADKLKDRALIAQAKQQAIEDGPDYAAERHCDRLLDFVAKFEHS